MCVCVCVCVCVCFHQVRDGVLLLQAASDKSDINYIINYV